jgi:hypothetical protein
MGKPLTIQESDDQRLNSLKRPLGLRSKVDVLRKGLDLLEKQVKRDRQISQWQRAARLVAPQSAAVNKEFQSFSRLHKND